MSRVDDLLAETKALLGDFKNFNKPLQNKEADSQEAFRALGIRYPRITKIYTVLVPENYEWKATTVDVYTDEILPTDRNVFDTTYVFHGHPRQLVCFAPHFCHVLGYTPVGNESPVFLKAWKDKWG